MIKQTLLQKNEYEVYATNIIKEENYDIKQVNFELNIHGNIVNAGDEDLDYVLERFNICVKKHIKELRK